MSADSSKTTRRRSPDPRLPVRAGSVLGVRAIWIVPLITGSVVVAAMTTLYIWSVVNPLAHLRGLPVAVVNQDRGATVGSQHLEVGEQVQAGLLANRAVSHWLHLEVSSLPEAEGAMSRGALYATVVIPPDLTASLLSVSVLNTPGATEPRIQVLTNQRAGTVGTQLATGILQPALGAASQQIGRDLTALMPASELRGATKVVLADPVTITTVQYRPLPPGTALGLSAFYVALLTLMCGFLGGTIVNSVVDSGLGYATTETGPRWRQRQPVPIDRWQTLLVKWAIVVAVTAVLTGVVLLVAAGALGMDAPHPATLWLFMWLCAASVAAGTIVLFAVAGTPGQLIGLLIFVYAGLASAGGDGSGRGPAWRLPRPQQHRTATSGPGRNPVHHVLQRPGGCRSHPGDGSGRAGAALLGGPGYPHREVVRPQRVLPPASRRPRPRQRIGAGLQVPVRETGLTARKPDRERCPA
jgi:YhgE/Pip-like protein